MSIDLKEKKRRKFLHLLTYFLTSDTIQFFDETKCNMNESKCNGVLQTDYEQERKSFCEK